MKLLKFIVFAAVVLLLVVLLRRFVFSLCTLTTPCMENTYHQGERVMLNKWSYRLGRPVRRGDVVMFRAPSPASAALPDTPPLYISRCIAAAGDTLLVDSLLRAEPTDPDNPDIKAFYSYPESMESAVDSTISLLPIAPGTSFPLDSLSRMRCLSRYECYLIEQALPGQIAFTLVERGTSEQERPIVIPKQGVPVAVTPESRALLCHALVSYEGQNAQVIGDSIYIGGSAIGHWTFAQDYCFVASDNPLFPCDSRQLGLIPRSLLAGRVTGRWKSREQGPLSRLRDLLK